MKTTLTPSILLNLFKADPHTTITLSNGSFNAALSIDFSNSLGAVFTADIRNEYGGGRKVWLGDAATAARHLNSWCFTL